MKIGATLSRCRAQAAQGHERVWPCLRSSRSLRAASPTATMSRLLSRGRAATRHLAQQRSQQQAARRTAAAAQRRQQQQRRATVPRPANGPRCFMYEHERKHGARRRTGASHPPPTIAGARSRALDGRRHARAEQQQRQQRRASVPRPAKGCGDSCTDMSVNMTQLISRRARRTRRRRDKQGRERAPSRGALDEQRQQRAGQQQQQQRRAAVPRPVKGRGVSCAIMNIIERTAVTHSSSGLCEYPSVPRPVEGRGGSCTNVNVKERSNLQSRSPSRVA